MSNPDDPRSWLAKADSDLLVIENNVTASRVPWDAVCFHAQQAAEKALKAVLAAQHLPIERTHDLESLLHDCVGTIPTLASLRRDSKLPHGYSVSPRYPDARPHPPSAQGQTAPPPP